MTLTDWATALSGFTAVGVVILGGLRWVIRKYVTDYVVELKPNGGSSINDMIKLQILPMLKEMRQDQLSIKSQVDKLEGRFEQHLEDN